MASAQYMTGRKKYIRPQQVVWTNEYTIDPSGMFIPSGVEFQDFIILSDHNKTELTVSAQRIESRKRMVNGTMRSYHISDKYNFSWSWEMLPSRAFPKDPLFNVNTGKNGASLQYTEIYTVDAGAGGVELLNWYETHSGPFYMLLAFDKYNEFNTNKYNKLQYYNVATPVYFSSFDYDVVKRGFSTFDFWNISVGLEEV